MRNIAKPAPVVGGRVIIHPRCAAETFLEASPDYFPGIAYNSLPGPVSIVRKGLIKLSGCWKLYKLAADKSAFRRLLSIKKLPGIFGAELII